MAEKNFAYNRSGVAHAGAYQVAGYPYITGSSLNNNEERRVKFPTVAKSVTVISRANVEIRVHFNSKSTADVINGKHYITLDTIEDSVTFNVKCKEIYISAAGNNASYELFASLTGIPTSSMYELSGPGLTTGADDVDD